MRKELFVELKGVNAGYDKKEVLTRVNFSVHHGDFIGIIGPNGSGKTTLIKVLMGLHQPSSGAVIYYHNGVPTSAKPSIGYLPQQNQIDKDYPITVYEVILSGLLGSLPIIGKISAAIRDQVDRMVEEMGLSGLERRPIGQLSGGQLQRTLLGRAMVSAPDVLILDEPSSYVDRLFEDKMYEILVRINKETTILMVSHDITSVLAYANTIACVNRSVHTHPNKELPDNWIHHHYTCYVDRYEKEVKERGVV